MGIRLWGLLLLVCNFSLSAQQELGRYWFEDMDEIPRLEPYQVLDVTGYMVFPRYDPVQQIGEGAFVYLWKPRFAGLSRRKLTRFNLFMEPEWESEFRLNPDEHVFYFTAVSDQLVVLSVEINYREKRQDIFARYFEPDSGSCVKKEVLATFSGGSESPVFFTQSRDNHTFLLFQLRREEGTRRVTYYTDFLNSRGEPGFLATRATEILHSSFDRDLHLLHSGTTDIPMAKKAVLLDVAVDDSSNIYVSWFDKPDHLSMLMVSEQGDTYGPLSVDEFPRPEVLRYLYDTGFPPYIGQPGHAYLPLTDRVEKGRGRGIKGFQVMHMDFLQKEVRVSHQISATSGLLVEVEKGREEINSRKLRRFDQYVIRDLEFFPDGSMWMSTQYFAHDNFRGLSTAGPGSPQTSEQLVGELIIYVFDSTGRPKKAIIVPSSYTIRNVRDRMNQYADLSYDHAQGRLNILIREYSGDNHRGPARLYYRAVDLNSGEVSPRTMLYHPTRRSFHAPVAFMEWLNKDILQILSYEGEDERIYGVTINLALPPLTEEETRELRGNR